MGSPFDCIRDLAWNIPGDLVLKLIFEKLTAEDMEKIIKAEKLNEHDN